jgi:5-(carboxyamino)imidazole ribonucleotide synthase
MSNNILKPNSTIGIFGGGQLGRMICFAANQLGYRTIVFSDIDDSPASFVSNQTIVADYLDKIALSQFVNKIDIATFEFENIPTKSINFVNKTKPTFPNSNVLEIIQNRLKEKDFINQIGIKTTKYLAVSCLEDLQLGLEKFNFKAILKTATMGYDGKGQVVLNHQSDLRQIWKDFRSKELILEEFADFEQEISIVIAKSTNNEVVCYQPLTNIHQNGILFQSFYPARISAKITSNAVEIAQQIISNLNLIGVLAVEFFVLKNGDLLVNELAPRPHNSGHFSLDGSYTNQFEQLIRAIVGLPLGCADFHSTGFMQNLIGDDILTMGQYLNNKKAKIHLYGKNKIALGRKMGHINFIK